MPGVPVLSRLKAIVSDDVGTVYSSQTGQLAGDGTEWRARWFFSPLPPEVARELRVNFEADGSPTGHECRIKVP